MTSHPFHGIVVALAMLLGVSKLAFSIDSNWSQFRGPEGDGISIGKELPINFNESEHVRWKTAIHGRAWSSPVIWGSQIWMSTANDEGTELSAVCVDKETGEIIRDEVLFQIEKPQFCHKFNSYASPTPVIEKGRVYVTFGSPGTACLDTATGKKIWERTDFVCNHYRAAGSSPILWKDLLLMNFDGSDEQYMVALDTATGKTVWRTDRSVDFQDLDANGKPGAEGDMRKGFATPHVYESNGQSILLSSGSKAHYAYDPRTGKELWRIEDRSSHSPCTRPVVGHGLAYIPSGHGKAGMLVVKLGGNGVLDETSIAWTMTKTYSNKPSVTLVGDLLFVINDLGIASCVDATSGENIWTHRLGGNFSSSPIVSGGRIYVGNEEGKFFVFEASREFKLLAENQFSDGFMASPAVDSQSLYLRSRTHLYRIEK